MYLCFAQDSYVWMGQGRWHFLHFCYPLAARLIELEGVPGTFSNTWDGLSGGSTAQRCRSGVLSMVRGVSGATARVEE